MGDFHFLDHFIWQSSGDDHTLRIVTRMLVEDDLFLKKLLNLHTQTLPQNAVTWPHHCTFCSVHCLAHPKVFTWLIDILSSGKIKSGVWFLNQYTYITSWRKTMAFCWLRWLISSGQKLESEDEHDKTDEAISQTQPVTNRKKRWLMRLRIKRVGMCTNWKQLEAWILKCMI